MQTEQQATLSFKLVNLKLKRQLIITIIVTLLLMAVNAFMMISEGTTGAAGGCHRFAVVPLGLAFLLQTILSDINDRPRLLRVWIVVSWILVVYGLLFMFW